MMHSLLFIPLTVGLATEIYASRYVTAEMCAAIHHRATYWFTIETHRWLWAVLIPLVILIMGLMFALGFALPFRGGSDRWMSLPLVFLVSVYVLFQFKWVRHAKEAGAGRKYLVLERASGISFLIAAVFLALS